MLINTTNCSPFSLISANYVSFSTRGPMPPSTLAGSRDNAMTAGGGYSASNDVNKFRTDQNSSPVPNAINTQVSTRGLF